MKIKTLILLALTLCLTIGLCACGNNTPSDTATATTTTTTAESTTTTTTTTTTESTTTTTKTDATQSGYTVKVVDESGNPIAGVMVQWCLEACVPGVTNAQGIASPLSPLPDAKYKVSVIESSLAQTGYSVENNEFYYEEGAYEMTIVLKKAA